MHARFVAWLRVRVEREMARMANDRLTILELAHAQFGALQVAKNADRAVEFSLQLADRLKALAVIFMLAMAHIEAERIRASEQQFPQHVLVPAGWANRGEDFDLAAARAELLGRCLCHRNRL